MALTKVTTHVIADDISLGGNPTTTTQSAGNNTTRIATTAFVTGAVSDLVDGAPSTLNTLNEIAAALNDDAALNTTLTNSIALKAPLASPSLTGTVTITGASSAYNTLQLTSNSTGHGTIINLGDTSDADYGSITQFATSAGEGGRMRFIAGTTETMNLKGGNVGIGTSSPSTPLHIQTNDSTTNAAVNSLQITNLSTGTTTTGFGGEIRFQAERNNGVNQNTGSIKSIAEVNSGADISSGLAFGTGTAGVVAEAGRFTYTGDFLVGSSTNLNVLSGTPKIQVGDGSGHASMQFYSGTGSVGALYFGDATSGADRYPGYIEYRHNSNQMAFQVGGSNRFFINSNGNVGINESPSNNVLQIKDTAAGGPQIQLGDGTNYSFINFDGTNLQLATQRDMVDGTWYNTSKSWGGINIQGKTDGSQITMATAPNANTSPTTRFVLNKNGSLILGSTAATAGKTFEIQDRQSGYSSFWVDDNNRDYGRGITNAYGLLGGSSTQYDGDGATYPVYGFGGAADNHSSESLDFYIKSTTSEWQSMVFFAIAASTSNAQTGQTAGWALIRATHYNNSVSSYIMDSGGGGTFSLAVVGSMDSDDYMTVRIAYSGGQNRCNISVWCNTYQHIRGVTR